MKLYFPVPSLCVDPIEESKFSFLTAAGLFFFSSSASEPRSQLLAQPHVRFFTTGIVLPFHCFTFPHSSSFGESDYGLIKL